MAGTIHSIAAGALAALSTGQAVAANNLANVNTPGFRASSVSQSETTGGGVSATPIRGDDPVDISREAATLLLNANLYNANLGILKAGEETDRALLDIKV